MKPCELSEFTFLLKMGLWSGGAVSGLGHVSAASKTDTLPMAGLAGLLLGGGVMLERSEEQRLIMSVYDPYDGRYRCFTVSADFNTSSADRPVTMDEIEKALTMVLEQETKNARRGKGLTFKEYTPWREKRRYEANYYSPRSGALPKPGRR